MINIAHLGAGGTPLRARERGSHALISICWPIMWLSDHTKLEDYGPLKGSNEGL